MSELVQEKELIVPVETPQIKCTKIYNSIFWITLFIIAFIVIYSNSESVFSSILFIVVSYLLAMAVGSFVAYGFMFGIEKCDR